jgi:serine acetyltransferase
MRTPFEQGAWCAVQAYIEQGHVHISIHHGHQTLAHGTLTMSSFTYIIEPLVMKPGCSTLSHAAHHVTVITPVVIANTAMIFTNLTISTCRLVGAGSPLAAAAIFDS